jgi:hypothetical protein
MTRAEGAPNPEAWEKSSTLWQALGQPYDAAYCRFRQGEALLELGQTEEGNSMLAAAAETAERLGAIPLARMIDGVRRG